jgi:outer membrane protein W
MKKLSTVLCVILFAAMAVNAQELKTFRVGVGAGYAKPGGAGSGGGVLFTIEPGYRITDQILVNLRWESAAVVRGTVNDTGADLSVAGIGSYTLNGQYYLSDNSFRPFVGLGFGMYKLAAVSVSGSSTGGSTAAAAESKIGFYPRIGFDAKHFTLNLDYNFIPNTTAGAYEFKNSYIGIRLGGYFGGGRK